MLIESLKEIVFPYFTNLGFVELPSRQIESGDSKKLFPLGTLTRINSDKSVDLIDFQFGKYGGPNFQLHFSQIPESGGYTSFQLLSQADSLSSGVGEHGRYRPSIPFVSNPVSFSINPKRAIEKTDIEKKLSKWMRGLDQIERWFHTREVGPYIVTFENLSRGVCISRGFPKMFVMRETSISFMSSTRGNIFGENNVDTLSEAIAVAESYYETKGEKLEFSTRFWWNY